MIFGPGRCQGQEEIKTGSPADLAGDLDPTFVLFDDAIHRGQAEPGALAGALGGEERLENARQNLRRNAHPGVAHGQTGKVPGAGFRVWPGGVLVQMHGGSGDVQAAALGHRITGVDGWVQENLVQHAAVGVKCQRDGCQLESEADMFAQHAREHLGQAGDKLVEFQAPGIQGLATAEEQELPVQVRRALGRLPDFLQRFPDFRGHWAGFE